MCKKRKREKKAKKEDFDLNDTDFINTLYKEYLDKTTL